MELAFVATLREPSGFHKRSRWELAFVATALWAVCLYSCVRTTLETAHRAVATDMAVVAIQKPRRRRAPWLQVFRVKEDFGRRPLRLGRVFEASPLYFVTFCTHDRIPRLARDEIHSAFVLFARRADRDFNVAIGRYVIMPEHVHLFVRGGPDFTLGRWVGVLKQTLARAANLSGVNTRFWQEGFFDHVLRSDESYSQKWNYVRENPVRAGFVKSAEEGPYQGEIVYIDRA
jgi:putative transposase